MNNWRKVDEVIRNYAHKNQLELKQSSENYGYGVIEKYLFSETLDKNTLFYSFQLNKSSSGETPLKTTYFRITVKPFPATLSIKTKRSLVRFWKKPSLEIIPQKQDLNALPELQKAFSTFPGLNIYTEHSTSNQLIIQTHELPINTETITLIRSLAFTLSDALNHN